MEISSALKSEVLRPAVPILGYYGSRRLLILGRSPQTGRGMNWNSNMKLKDEIVGRR